MNTNSDFTSRIADPAETLDEFGPIGGTMFAAVGNGSVPRETVSLVQLRAGQLVGSTYLAVLHTGNLRKADQPEDKITAVATWKDAPYFSPAERAALALVEAVLTPNPDGERVPDDLFGEVSKHYDEKALLTLVTAIGQVNFFIPLALTGKPLPGVPPTEQWQR